MNSEERNSKMQELDGRSFRYDGRVFDVIGTEYHNGRHFVYTAQERRFIKDGEQFERFLQEIKLLPEGEKSQTQKQFIPKPMETKPLLSENDAQAVDATISTADAITSALMQTFNELNTTPTEETFKKASAQTDVARTMVMLAQTKINYMKLKLQK